MWHGSADRTVNPGNADEIVKQWLDVHGLPLAPMSVGDVDNIRARCGGTLTAKRSSDPLPPITDMALLIGIADNDERYGESGAF